MAAVIGKRKREQTAQPSSVKTKRPANQDTVLNQKENSAATKPHVSKKPYTQRTPQTVTPIATANGNVNEDVTIQIVTGSYERVLHGITATIPGQLLSSTSDQSTTTQDNGSEKSTSTVTFSDTFLFASHASSVRCLAISPPTENDRRLLATGSSDERINLYNVSTIPPSSAGRGIKPSMPSLSGTAITENPRNKSLGSLVHHDRAITRLVFPTKGKLFSSAEDSTIAISRTRDWTVLSSIKAPIPKVQGRPSGDTAAPGEVPAGVNDFAIHPSHKLMLSVGRGEKCMRLWNLMTGKKAGVLNFERDLLIEVGERKFSSGEGRRVLWDAAGENYVVGFERGAAVFGIDSKPKAVLKASPVGKLHEMRFLPDIKSGSVLAVSTEDGRILFFSTQAPQPPTNKSSLPQCRCIAVTGGISQSVFGRVKDFSVLTLSNGNLLLVAGSSDGAIRLWSVSRSELESALNSEDRESAEPTQIGRLVGMLETGDRVTCLDAFIMDGIASNAAVDEAEEPTNADELASSSSSSDSE